MKRKSLIFLLLAFVLLPVSLLATGCGETIIDAQNDGQTSAPTITNWYDYEDERYLDTSINIDFDKIKPSELYSIKFSLYDGETLLGTRESYGEMLENLLKDCAQYWDKTEDTYLEVTGVRTLSCAFKPRESGAESDFWISSKCTAEPSKIPNGLVVEVVANEENMLNRYKAVLPASAAN